MLEIVKQYWSGLNVSHTIPASLDQETLQKPVVFSADWQKLIDVDASGIVFTINVVTNQTDEMLIIASWGLWDAPGFETAGRDVLLVNKLSGRLSSGDIGEKRRMAVPTKHGITWLPVQRYRRKCMSLSFVQIGELAVLGNKFENLYGAPVKMIWALSQGDFSIMRIRPILD